MKKHFDYLGNEIKVGQRAIIVKSNSGYFDKVTILNIKEQESHNLRFRTIEVLSDGNIKSGWTFPTALIVETAFKNELK